MDTSARNKHKKLTIRAEYYEMLFLLDLTVCVKLREVGHLKEWSEVCWRDSIIKVGTWNNHEIKM